MVIHINISMAHFFNNSTTEDKKMGYHQIIEILWVIMIIGVIFSLPIWNWSQNWGRSAPISLGSIVLVILFLYLFHVI
jgi:glucan phosphoethanolaminetransferase (alkaline phosphatase superfamily)